MKIAEEITRGDLLRKGMAATTLGAAALAMPGLARAQAPTGGVSGSESQIG